MKAVLPEKNSQQAQDIEKAVAFLVTRMLESGHNPKPVILHGIRMGMYLYNFNYEPDIVKAAILHDIIEDSDTSLAEIAERFGEKVAQLVQANTFDYTVGDRAAQGEECLQRCLKCGRDALIVKAADKLENSFTWWIQLLPRTGPNSRLSRCGICLISHSLQLEVSQYGKNSITSATN